MAVRQQGLNAAVHHYNELLQEETLAEASAAALQEGEHRCDLYFGDRPISVSLRPYFITRERWDYIVGASETVCTALHKLEAELLRDSELRAELDLSPEEESLVLAAPPSLFSCPSSRLDAFDSDELRYVEYNAESPAGMAYYDNLVDVFDELPVMRRFRERFRLSAMRVQGQQRQSMLQSFREWGGADRPVIAIVDWQDVPTLKEHRMFQEHFQEAGIETVMCDPRELEVRDDRLYAGPTEVNLIYRRILTTELLSRDETAREALVKAYKAGIACVLNTFRAKLLHRKLSLGLLSDPRCDHLFTDHEKRAIARHVPWTRKVREGRCTGGDGSTIPDLAEHILTHREELALKPNDEYGGKGVVLGWTASPEEWEAALKAALEDSYVVQTRVAVPTEPYPVVMNGVELVDMMVDTDPYLFRCRVGGCLTRLSSSALLNVTAGTGSVVPAYVVEGEA